MVDPHPAHSPQTLWSHSPVGCHLTLSSSDEESPTPDINPLHGRAEQPSLVQYHMDYHHTPTPGTDDSFQDIMADEEDFPTVPLDYDIWFDDPIPDRHLCIH